MTVIAEKFQEKADSYIRMARVLMPVSLSSADKNNGEGKRIRKGRGVAVKAGVTLTNPPFNLSEDVVKASAGLFSNKKMFIDHVGFLSVPSVRNEAGFIKSSSFDEAEKGVVIDFVLFDEELEKKLSAKDELEITETTSLSAVIKFEFKRKNEEDFKSPLEVTKILDVFSVDFVFDAASVGSRVTEVSFHAIHPDTFPSTISLNRFLELRPEYQNFIGNEFIYSENGKGTDNNNSNNKVSGVSVPLDSRSDLTDPKTKQEDGNMTPEELKRIVGETIDEKFSSAIKPISDRIESLEKNVKEAEEKAVLESNKGIIKNTLNELPLHSSLKASLYSQYAPKGDIEGFRTHVEAVLEAQKEFTDNDNENGSGTGKLAGSLDLGTAAIPLNGSGGSNGSGKADPFDHTEYQKSYWENQWGEEFATEAARAAGSK